MMRRMRFRVRVIRFRRSLLAQGWKPGLRTEAVARLCAGLDVPPDLVVQPGDNHWSSWTDDAS